MEEITHYKFIDERFSQTKVTYSVVVDPVGDDLIDELFNELEVQTKKASISTTVQSIDESVITNEEFRLAMSRNEHVQVFFYSN